MNVEDFDKPAEMPDIPIVDSPEKFPPGIGNYGALLFEIEKELGWPETLPPTFTFMQRMEAQNGNFAYARWRYDMQEVSFMASKGH